MRTMVDLGSQRGPIVLHIMDTATSVACSRDVRFRKTFRSLIECMVPACCTFHPTLSDDYSSSSSPSSTTTAADSFSDFSSTPSPTTHASTVTGTFFGLRKGRVSFCFQDDTKSSPLLLLELGIPTSFLAKEMQYGLLRIALVECKGRQSSSTDHDHKLKNDYSLFSVPLWSVFFNGRKIGFANRRSASESDTRVLKMMQSVSVGAGVLPGNKESAVDDYSDQRMYLSVDDNQAADSMLAAEHSAEYAAETIGD